MKREKVSRLALSFLIFSLIGTTSLAAQTPDLSEGKSLLTRNRSAQAVDYFRQAVENHPQEKESYLFLAIAYEQQNSYIEAIAVLNLALFRLGPDHQLYYNLGNCYYGLTNYGEAAQHYTFAINHDPDYAEAYLNRANSNVKLRQYQAAIDDYTIYLQLRPEDEQEEAIIKMIELLRQKAEMQSFGGNTGDCPPGYYGGGGGGGSGGSGGSGSGGTGNNQLDDVLKSFDDLENDTENMNIRPEGEVEDDYDLEFDIE